MAEGIGPKTPGNLGAPARPMSVTKEAEKVLNPTGVSIKEIILKDEVKTSLRNLNASLSTRGFFMIRKRKRKGKKT